MGFFTQDKVKLPTPEQALPGRNDPIVVSEKHVVLGSRMREPFRKSAHDVYFSFFAFLKQMRTSNFSKFALLTSLTSVGFWGTSGIGGSALSSEPLHKVAQHAPAKSRLRLLIPDSLAQTDLVESSQGIGRSDCSDERNSAG